VVVDGGGWLIDCLLDMKVKFVLMMVALMVLAVFLRVYRLDYLELFGDELDAGYQSYSLLMTGRDYKGNLIPAYIHSFSEWRAPGLMYAMVPFIKIFGLNEFGVRMVSSFFGILGISGFALSLKLLNIRKKVIVAVIFFITVSPWHIQYSRAGFELTLLSSLLIWGAYFLILGLKRSGYYFTVLSGFLLSLGFYTYNTANIYVPLLALMTLIVFRASKKQYLILFLVGLVFSLPMIYQIFYGHAADRFGKFSVFADGQVVVEMAKYREASGNAMISKVFYNKYVVVGKKILFNYLNAFSPDFLFRNGDITFRHSLRQVGNLYWIMAPLVIVGLLVTMTRKKKVVADFWLLGLLLLAPIPSSLTIDGYNHASRLFLMIYPLMYFAGLGFANLTRGWWVAAMCILIFEFCNFQYYYWNFYRDQSSRWWHYGYKEAMLYIANNYPKYDRVLMDNTYEPSLIRFLFWNKVDPASVFGVVDKMDKQIDGFDGFCISPAVCFVDFYGRLESNKMNSGVLYLISQEKNVGGDWDWSKDPPSGIKTVKTIRDFDGLPLFYLVEKDEGNY
jgi:hypothetical protein